MLETQVRDMARQLPPEKQVELAIDLLLGQWRTWHRLSEQGQASIRAIARERGLDWDKLSEEEREQPIDTILHEP